MGRAPCCDKEYVKKGPWSPEEDAKLKEYIEKHGTGGNWIALPQKAGLRRCGKSCRLRWLNYLRPNIKHGEFSDNEDRIICTLFASIGSRWSIIAAQLPGRTDNDIKNYWNTKLKKKLMGIGIGIGNQRRPHHQLATTTYSSISLFQSSSSSSSYSSPSSPLSSSYKCYNTQTSSFTGFEFDEPISIPSNYLNTSTCYSSNAAATTTVVQAQEGFVGPTLLFGGEAASCSSDDAEFLQSYYNDLYNGDGEKQKFMLSSSGGGSGDANEFYGGETPLDYYGTSSVEEIRQLIISTNNI